MIKETVGVINLNTNGIENDGGCRGSTVAHLSETVKLMLALMEVDYEVALNLAMDIVDTFSNFEPYVIEDREMVTDKNSHSDHLITKSLSRKPGHG